MQLLMAYFLNKKIKVFHLQYKKPRDIEIQVLMVTKKARFRGLPNPKLSHLSSGSACSAPADLRSARPSVFYPPTFLVPEPAKRSPTF